MNILPFLPKDDQELPDNYGATIYYVNGKKEEFELAQHRLNDKTMVVEFATKEDLWSWVPLSSIQRIEFDKRLSKLVALKEKHDLSKDDTKTV
jgi:hypothetical protein